MFLEDGDWQQADEYCNKVLDIDPENTRAYLGKLMAELKIGKQEDLKKCSKAFDNSKNYQKIIRFAEPGLSETILGYNSYIKERNETERLTNIYNNAVSLMQTAYNEEMYHKAQSTFMSVSDFKDASSLAEACASKAEELKAFEIKYQKAMHLFESAVTSDEIMEAKNLFASIPEYKESAKYVQKCDCFCVVKVYLLDSRNIFAPANGSTYVVDLNGQDKKWQLRIVADKGVVMKELFLPFGNYDGTVQMYGWNDKDCTDNSNRAAIFQLSISDCKEKSITMKRQFTPEIIIKD